MDNTTIILVGFVISSLGLSTIIGFIAKIWHKTETHDKELERIEREVQEVKQKEAKDFDELKKKNEMINIAIAKLENLPTEIRELRHDIRNLTNVLDAKIK